MVNFYNGQGIGVNFTFSNTLLSEKHLKNKLGNQALKKFDKPFNGIIVASDLFRDYIRRQKYAYQLIRSMTKVIYDRNKLLSEIPDYDLVVISPEFNRDIVFLKNIPADKAEILINGDCVPFCPYKQQHYDLMAKDNLNTVSTLKPVWNFCQNVHRNDKPRFGTLNLSSKEVRQIFQKTGISHFKVSLRGKSLSDRIYYLTEFFIKTRYQAEFSHYMRNV
jgi:hypothetical protein